MEKVTERSCFNTETNDFDQPIACRAPVCWSKYTTPLFVWRIHECSLIKSNQNYIRLLWQFSSTIFNTKNKLWFQSLVNQGPFFCRDLTFLKIYLDFLLVQLQQLVQILHSLMPLEVVEAMVTYSMPQAMQFKMLWSKQHLQFG